MADYLSTVYDVVLTNFTGSLAPDRDSTSTVYLDTSTYIYTTSTGDDATYYTVFSGSVSQEQENGEIAMATV